MLWLWRLPNRRPQIRLKHSGEQLQQNFEADLCHSRVIPALAELVPDERVLRPGELVEASNDARFAHGLADEVAALGGDVGVLDAEDHGALGVGEGGEERNGRVGSGGWGAKGGGVDVCCEVGDAGGDAGVELGWSLSGCDESTWRCWMLDGILPRRGRRDGRLDTCPWSRCGQSRWAG